MPATDQKHAVVEVGSARIVAEVPVSDGTTALEILNFRKTAVGSLESRFRVLPLINPGLCDDDVPEVFSNGCVGIGYMDWSGTVPELLFLTTDGVYRYAPWLRPDAPDPSPLLDEQFVFTEAGDTESVTPQGDQFFPPQLETVGNRIYFTFCDGGGAWVWDRERLRPFGFTRRPSGPGVQGPTDAGTDDPNGGGFSASGRIGTIDSDWTLEDGGVLYTVGGVDDGEYDYFQVLEGPDGAYSATSERGGTFTMRKELADKPGGSGQPYPERLRKRARVQNMDADTTNVAARILLRTANKRRLPDGDDGRPRFLHRLPGGNAPEYIDDIPDSELGAPWQDREQVPVGFYLMRSFGGSLFIARTEGAPARVWWSEQGSAGGPTPESFFAGHWRDVFPNTGAITALHSCYLSNGAPGPTLLVFKETACHFLNGEYPNWGIGTLHDHAGCAGPGCVQSLPDGSVVWYGNRTFWRMDRDGSVEDIGGPIRKRLARVNTTKARKGSSFVKIDTQEAFFCLPMDESTDCNYMFIYDWQFGGFRFMDQISSVDCVRYVPDSDVVLVAGTYNGDRNVYVWDRGAYFDSLAAPERNAFDGVNAAVFQSGWSRLDDTGMHNFYIVDSLVVSGNHAYEGLASVETFRNYDRRASTITTGNVSLASPQDETVVFYTDSDSDYAATIPAVDGEVYPEAAPYYCRVPVDATDTDVFCVKLTVPVHYVMDLVGVTAFATRQASAGRRAERLAEVA